MTLDRVALIPEQEEAPAPRVSWEALIDRLAAQRRQRQEQQLLTLRLPGQQCRFLDGKPCNHVGEGQAVFGCVAYLLARLIRRLENSP